MSTADDVRVYIRGSLLDLERRLDTQTAVEIARAVVEGATQALEDLSPGGADPAAPGRVDLPDPVTKAEVSRH
jgi:hypothetical protein